ncbi:MAG TPA: hypothetical protein VG056_09475 [Pirellulales bacterium]|jgi:hypothetical protein|nr:hypothetical protein [Pirellulales bacterium]
MAQKIFSFTLILAHVREITAEIEDALFESGCDDALLGMRCGVAFLDFDRASKSLSEAIRTAVRDVHQAGFDVIRVEPDDWVSAAEIARRTGRTRESIRQLASGARGPGGFPPPESSVTRNSPLWRWGEVAGWFSRTQPSALKLAKDAETIGKINAVLEVRRRVRNVSELQRLWKEYETGRKAKPRKKLAAKQRQTVSQ